VADGFDPEVDEERCLLTSAFPVCPRCQRIARPNILMFGDWGWLSERSDAQERRLQSWLHTVRRLLVIEVGAGTRIPSARLLGERLSGQLIRINPTEPQLSPGKGVSVAATALAALCAIEDCLG
jgi:NAD-dependent SIR2 family protein deacetylase